SKKVWSRIIAAATFFSLYGGIRASLDYGVRDARRAAAFVNDHLSRDLALQQQQIMRRERRTGVPGKLRRLFDRVANGQLTADQATRKAVDVLLEAGLDPDLAASLANDLALELSQMGQDRPRPLPRQ